MRQLRLVSALGLALIPAAAIVGSGIAMAGGGAGLTLFATLDGQGRSVPAGSVHSLRVTLTDVPGEASLRQILISVTDTDPITYTAATCDAGRNGSMSLEPEQSLSCTFSIPAKSGSRTLAVTASAHVPGQSAPLIRTQTLHYVGTAPPPPAAPAAPATPAAAPKPALTPLSVAAAPVPGAAQGRANTLPVVQSQPVAAAPVAAAPVAAAPVVAAPVVAAPVAAAPVAAAPVAAAPVAAVPVPAAPVPAAPVAAAPVPAVQPAPVIPPPVVVPAPAAAAPAPAAAPVPAVAPVPANAPLMPAPDPSLAPVTAGSAAACASMDSSSTRDSASSSTTESSPSSDAACDPAPKRHQPARSTGRLAHTGTPSPEIGEAAALATLAGLAFIRLGRTPAGWAMRNARVFGHLPTYPQP